MRWFDVFGNKNVLVVLILGLIGVYEDDSFFFLFNKKVLLINLYYLIIDSLLC